MRFLRGTNDLFVSSANKLYLFLGEGTNEQDSLKCFGVGCENPLHRWCVALIFSYVTSLFKFFFYLYSAWNHS